MWHSCHLRLHSPGGGAEEASHCQRTEVSDHFLTIWTAANDTRVAVQGNLPHYVESLLTIC